MSFLLVNHADYNPLVVALREEGVDVRLADWRRPLPDLTGCLGFYGNLFDEIKEWPALIRLRNQLRRHGVPYVFWNRDAPWSTGIKPHNLLALKFIKPVDIYLAHSLQDQGRFGGQAHYFPNAAQPGYYTSTDLRALRDESSYVYDVAYFGSFGNYRDRNAQRRAVFLDELHNHLQQAQPGIRFKAIDTARHEMMLDDQLSLIRRSKINLNVGAMCDLPRNPSWGLPERVFGIPAAGGLVISDARKHLEETFPGGMVPQFDSPEGCADQTIKMLNNFEIIRTLAEAQHECILNQHTYRHRARQLLDLLYTYKPVIT